MEEQFVILSDNRKILLNDDLAIVISVYYGNEIMDTFEVSNPSGGYGGGMLLLSPSEQYLLFSYYSGESEEAYMVFRILDSGLEAVYDSGYLYGEGASYLFTDSEEFLIQALPASVGPWYVEDAEIDENGNTFFDFCQINFLDLKNKTMDKHMVRVFPSDHWKAEIGEEPPCIIEMKENHILCMDMPWGREELELPLESVVLFWPSV